MNKKLILKLIEMDTDLRIYFGTIKKIELLSKRENIVYYIKGENKGIGKIGYRGWNKLEFENHKKLYENNYPVARPIKYIPIQGAILDNWGFGNLNRELGVLFCEYIEGEEISKKINNNLIGEAINLLKRIHNDERLKEDIIKNYQKIEVQRGKSYLKGLDDRLIEKLEFDLEKYENIPIELTFIHGGARLEHFLYNSKGVYVIDLEASSMGDPFKDLIYFLIDLYIHNLYSKDYLSFYFNRKLTLNEIERLNFFTIRQLLIKVKYGFTQKIKNDAIKFLKLPRPLKILGVN
ncbi:MAG: phosphotransferase [Candidatus Helarchaeota archaeon]